MNVNATSAESLFALTAVSPLDGRYAALIRPLSPIVSESGLIRYRLKVEVAWFKALCAHEGIPEARRLTENEHAFLDALCESMDANGAAEVKAIEQEIKHDVKSVEYYLKRRIQGTSMDALREFVHFACTSEDISNLAHALMLRDGLKILATAQQGLLESLAEQSRESRAVPMLGHTHGQPASPTTMGKELAVFRHRLHHALESLSGIRLTGKLNGAVGNYNAHMAAYPDVDWEGLARYVIEDVLGLTLIPLTTQIEPHDTLATVFHALIRWNTVLLDLDRDLWSYIAMGYLVQRPVKGEVGSSTMPHKVNPIDFENSEGNLGLANALLSFMAEKLPISRLQRDLSDSTVLRNLGSALGYSLIACQATRRGLSKIRVNSLRMQQDLEHTWEVLGEAIQTVMRKHGRPDPYERLKDLTRGRRITAETIRDFVSALDIPDADQRRLLGMTPASYIGLAERLADLDPRA